MGDRLVRMGWRSGLCAALALCLYGCGPRGGSVVGDVGTRPIGAAAPAGLGERALELVTELCALGPRDAGTPGAARAADWIQGQLTAFGYEVERDTFSDDTPDGTATFHNVTALLPGSASARIILLSHFDTKSGIADDFVGANDGGSSTGLLLALAEWLAGQQLRHTLEFTFLDGEECRYAYSAVDGLHGSRRRAAQLRGAEVDAVILLDMIGDQDLVFTIPRNCTPELKLLFLDAAKALGYENRVKLLNTDILDDHQPFLDAGFAAIDLIDFNYGSRPGLNDYWHTTADTLDKLSARTLQTVAEVVYEMLARLSAPGLHNDR